MVFFDYLVEHNRYLNLLGVVCVLVCSFLLSSQKKKINIRLTVSAILLHVVLAWSILKTTAGTWVLAQLAQLIATLYQSADSGISFLFGKLARVDGPWEHIFAIKVLPVIIFFAAITSLLSHFGIIQWVSGLMARLVRPLFGTSGAETLCAVANSFLGQTEAPLLIKKYLANMTRSEMFLVMVSGMGTISAALLAVYAGKGVPVQHLLCASVIAVPATILIAKMIEPESEVTETASGAKISAEVPSRNMLDAIAIGTSDGLQLVLNIGAILIVFIALIGALNTLLAWGCGFGNELFVWLGSAWRLPILSLEYIFGYLFLPVGWLLGFTGTEMVHVSELIGMKFSINELVAYMHMVEMPLSPRAIILSTYALCGFACFSSIGIQLGGIGVLAPSKRHMLSSLGFRALLGGTLANLFSAFVVGLLI